MILCVTVLVFMTSIYILADGFTTPRKKGFKFNAILVLDLYLAKATDHTMLYSGSYILNVY